jgi:hypothetical protein
MPSNKLTRHEAGVAPTVDVLTPAQAAAWLQVHPRELARLGVPCVKLGRKTRRYRRQQVLVWLESKAAA